MKNRALFSLILALALLSPLINAQAPTPTPRPTLAIDVLAATPTATPIDPSERLAALPGFGLQVEELPGGGVLNVPNAQNGTYNLVEQAAVWSIAYPDTPEVASLVAAYGNNGIVALSLSEYTAPNCDTISVYGLGSWVRLTTDEISAQGFIVDRTVNTLYSEAFGWERVSETALTAGNLYAGESDPALCADGTRYLYEYAYGVYVIGVIVHAADEVNATTLETIITSLSEVINGRIADFEGIAPATPAPIVVGPTITPTPNVIRDQLLTPPPVIGTAEAYFLTQTGLEPFSRTGGITRPTLVVRNPARPERYALTDAIGLLFVMDNANPARINITPFNDFIPPTRLENDDLVTDVAWSPDGQYLAFVIDSTGNTVRSPDAGVWYFQPQAFSPLQLLIDCPPGCEIVTRFDDPQEYTAKSVVWSPDSNALLVQIDIPATGRTGLIVFQRTNAETIRNLRPPVFNYDHGDWAEDGRIVVSGRSGENGRVILGLINRDNSGLQVVLDGSQTGLWLQNGTQRPIDDQAYSGELLALCRQGDGGGAMALCDQTGQRITSLTIGQTQPTYVRWNRDRSAVYVETQDGRKFIARIDGSITEVTDAIGTVEAVGWETGWLPPAQAAASLP
ncbi:MAG: hypothetical protein MUF87_14545 [Anaerolineae bacterium]|nr:hypothetical protein [Anaerolineae bacterium]